MPEESTESIDTASAPGLIECVVYPDPDPVVPAIGRAARRWIVRLTMRTEAE